MSTNYYLDEPHNDAGHLGKWNGTYFTAYAPTGVDTFDQWAAQMDGRQIFAEHGREATKDEVIEMATARRYGRAAAPYPGDPRLQARGDFMDRGALFVRVRFH